MDMEGLIKRELSLLSLKSVGGLAGGGCINNGQSYHSDRGKIFVKSHESHEVSVTIQLASYMYR